MKFVQIEGGSYVNANKIDTIYIKKYGECDTRFKVCLLVNGYSYTYAKAESEEHAEEILEELIEHLEEA